MAKSQASKAFSIFFLAVIALSFSASASSPFPFDPMSMDNLYTYVGQITNGPNSTFNGTLKSVECSFTNNSSTVWKSCAEGRNGLNVFDGFGQSLGNSSWGHDNVTYPIYLKLTNSTDSVRYVEGALDVSWPYAGFPTVVLTFGGVSASNATYPFNMMNTTHVWKTLDDFTPRIFYNGFNATKIKVAKCTFNGTFSDVSSSWADCSDAVLNFSNIPGFDNLPRWNLAYNNFSMNIILVDTNNTLANLAVSIETGGSLANGTIQPTIISYNPSGSGHGSFTTNWSVDTTGPRVSTVPDVSATATNNSGVIVTFDAPVATDLSPIFGSVNCTRPDGTPANGSAFQGGNNLITCKATDYFGNSGESTFYVNVTDAVAPVITLTGSPTVNVTIGNAYLDAGATASDNFNGNLTSSIAVNNTVNTSVVGTYLVTYNVNDSSNNPAAQVNRTVKVISASDWIASGESEVEVNLTTTSDLDVPASRAGDTINISFAAYVANDAQHSNVTVSSGMNITREGSSANYTEEIPAGTVISAPLGWNGIMEAPKVMANSVYSVPSGTINVVVQFGSSVRLDFNQSVKIVLGGMTGKKAGWTSGTGALTAITTVCNDAFVPTNVPANGECYVYNGSDLVIWTYHFTTFGAYTPVPVYSGTSSPGGYVPSASATPTPSPSPVPSVTPAGCAYNNPVCPSGYSCNIQSNQCNRIIAPSTVPTVTPAEVATVQPSAEPQLVEIPSEPQTSAGTGLFVGSLTDGKGNLTTGALAGIVILLFAAVGAVWFKARKKSYY